VHDVCDCGSGSGDFAAGFLKTVAPTIYNLIATPATPLNNAHPGGFFIAQTIFSHSFVKNACIVRALCVI